MQLFFAERDAERLRKQQHFQTRNIAGNYLLIVQLYKDFTLKWLLPIDWQQQFYIKIAITSQMAITISTWLLPVNCQ